MRERDCFNVFLDAAGDVALVAPGICVLKIGCDGGEETFNLLLTGLVLFDYVGG